jgi:two-component system, cell cycle response regulator
MSWSSLSRLEVRAPNPARVAWIGSSLGFVLAALFAIALGAGLFAPSADGFFGVQLCALLLASLFFALRFAQLLRVPRPEVSRELEAGSLFLVICYSAISVAGGASGFLAPLPFLLVALLCATTQLRSAFVLCLMAMVLEGALWRGVASSFWAVRFIFLGLFGFSYAVLLGVEIRRLRQRAQEELSSLRHKFTEEAHEFRLLDSARSADVRPHRGDAEELLARASVDSVRQTLFFTMSLVKKALGLHTCGLLWLSHDGEKLMLKEVVSDAELKLGPFAAGGGLFGSVVRQRQVVTLRRTRVEDDTISYYKTSAPVRAFIGVPVCEGAHFRGVLFADRLDDRPFTAAEEEALSQSAREVLRAIQFERLFADVEREKRRQGCFFSASRALLSARSLDEVLTSALETTRGLIEFEFGAVTFFDASLKQHQLVRVLGEGQEYEGHTFADNLGLAAMVVKNRHYLPAYGELRDPTAMIFDAKVKLKPYDSLLILPLIRPKRKREEQDPRELQEVLGSVAFGVRRRQVFSAEVRDMLEVVASQIAQSLENARLYDDLHRQATIDGLTGLLNRRHLTLKLEEALARAERHKKKLALIFTDVDHFKKVNDTYGHAVGDEVLRGISKCFKDLIRKVDFVGRYGGEEFCVVLEETDTDGALLMAERLREEAKKLSFASEKGPFHIAISLGVALYPNDASNKEELMEHADQALYFAKRNGRDQARLYADVFKKASA